jgi:hypothetical protein
LFSPDQWLNQYSLFSNKALPWPSSYVGDPTDAMGNPIAPPKQAAPAAAPATPGTTINSIPQQQFADLQAQVNQQTINSANAMLDNGIAAGTAPGYSGRGAETGIANYPGATDALIGLAKYQNQANQDYAAGKPIGMPQQAAPQAAPAAPATGLTYSQVLAMLANPGKVTTPGATVPASATSAQPSSGALQSFMQNFKPAQSGPGSGFQQDFSKTLKGLGY